MTEAKTKTYKGSCLCSAVKFELIGEFQSFFLCHCSRCQKDTGSAHAANLFAPSAKLVWTQGENDVKTYLHPNSRHAKSFCRHCGSALPMVADSIKSVVVPAGSLDEAPSILPTAKIFVGSCASWSKDLSDIPSFETFPNA